jgi:hypothetical protein
MTRTQLAANGFCVLLALISLGAAVWVAVSGQLHDLDGLFFVMVCLLFVLLFSIMPVMALRGGKWRELLPKKKAAAPAPNDQQVSQPASQKS